MGINFKDLVKKYEDESIKNLQAFVKINSIDDEKTSTKEKPFGEGVYHALNFMAELGLKNGFNVDRCDNYCTEISFGEGDLIAVYAHADVVPVSGKWHHEPFGAEIKDGIMYGRGTSDDKGPAIAAFYALKALKENNLIDGYKVSLVIGGNEEKGSRCLDHYFHVLKKPYPKYGFTPDGSFPLIYGEKGITGYLHTIKINLPGVKSIEGGLAANSVIDNATLVIEHNEDLKDALETYFKDCPATYKIINKNDIDEIIVFGKASHGSMPQLGINAGLHLIKFLGTYFNNGLLKEVADDYLEPFGHKLGCFYEGKYLHETTFNVGIAKYENNKLELVVNFRYPENCDPKVVEKKLQSLNIGEIKFFGYGEYLLVDPNEDMIKTLTKIYQEESGDYKTPIMTIGGGTYAKESKNTIAFGSAFPGRDDHIHSPDEEIHLSDFLLSQSIYARAIYELGKLK